MKKLFILFFCALTFSLIAQDRFYTRNGHIDFYSHAPLEDIRANNDQVAAFLETASGEFTFAVLMKSFEFKKALMQEHFNENYVESDQYPRAMFKGTILSFSKIDLFKEGSTYQVTVKGKLTIHGITKEIEAPGTLKIEKGKILATSTFKVKPVDYDIKIPAAVKNNIAEIIDVNVKVELIPFEG